MSAYLQAGTGKGVYDKRIAGPATDQYQMIAPDKIITPGSNAAVCIIDRIGDKLQAVGQVSRIVGVISRNRRSPLTAHAVSVVLLV